MITNINEWKYIVEISNYVFYHGSTDSNISGKNGIHIGTYKAAKEALEARIGIPVNGEWDGTKEYGKTLLAGKKTLHYIESTENRYVCSGYNCGNEVPEDDYLPTQRIKLPQYSDGSLIAINCKPNIFKVQIIGDMSNTPNNPHSDIRANSMMLRNLKMGNAKRGYYYINDGEDVGSISAVVPDKSFLRIL